MMPEPMDSENDVPAIVPNVPHPSWLRASFSSTKEIDPFSQEWSVLRWVREWTPDPLTSQWMKLGSGTMAPSGPPPLLILEDLIRDHPQIDHAEYESFAKRVLNDFHARGVYIPQFVVPNYDPLKVITVSGVKRNGWDPLRFLPTRILADLFSIGFHEAGPILMRMVYSYWVNAKFPYLRTGGSKSMPYGTGGRPRCAAGVVFALSDFLKISSLSENLNSSFSEQAIGLLRSHVGLILASMPLEALPDGPNGDHLNVPFVEAFQLGELRASMLSARSVCALITAKGPHNAIDIMDTCEKVIDQIDQILSNSILEDEISFPYDIRIDPETKEVLPRDPTDKIVTGISSVNAWIAAGGGSHTHGLVNNATEIDWPKKYPQLWYGFISGAN